MSLPEKYILITGATSGIGLALIEQLVEQASWKYKLHICLTCRNLQKGEHVKQKLDLMHTDVKIKLVKLDVGSMESVSEASQIIKEMYLQIDCIYLIAGIMPVTKLNWTYIVGKCITMNFVDMFRTGDGAFEVNNQTTNEGVKSIFATNVLGHFLLVQELTPLLSKSKTSSQVVWTSSTNASREAFDFDDVTCRYGSKPYASSKYIVDAMNVELNKQLNDQNIYSHIADPGTAFTNLTSSILPFFIWYIIFPLAWLSRLVLPNLTIFPSTACHSMVWLLDQRPEQLRSDCKYSSRASVTNRISVEEEPLNISADDSRRVFDRVRSLAAKYVAK